MSFEAWRRALLVRSGILGTLQREWKLERTRDAERASKGLERVTRDLARLQQTAERVHQKVAEAAERTKRHDDRLDRQAADIDRLSAASVDADARAAALQRDVALARMTLMINAAHPGERHNGALAPDAIAAHITRSVLDAEVSTDPMPHLLVHNVLPSATYDALLDAIPPAAFFSQRDPIKRNLKVRQLSIAPDWTLRAWSFFEDAVIPDMLVPAFVGRLQPWLTPGTAYHASAGRLMLRGPGYHLDPHLDPKRVTFTCLIYLARPGDSESFGTQLFRIDRTPEARRDQTFYPEEEGYRCEQVSAVPFRPNAALVFINGGGAHGADIPATAPAATERYAYQFYVSPAT